MAPRPSGSPFVGPRPFEPRDREFFFGRSREARDLFDLVLVSPAVLLYSKSGAGKSSLVNAGLTPLAASQGRKVLPAARVAGGLLSCLDSGRNPLIANAIECLEADLGRPNATAASSLTEYLAGRPDRAEDRILIFDQFEECFTQVLPFGFREQFFRDVSEALNGKDQLSAIFVMREEYIAELDPYLAFLPDRLARRLRLVPLTRSAARLALIGPLEQRGVPLEAGVAERLLDSLSEQKVQGSDGRSHVVPGEFIEPVQLQVIASELWESLPPGAPRISLAQVQALDSHQALAAWLEKSVRQVESQSGQKYRAILEWCRKVLITPAGTRAIVFRGAQDTAGMPNAVVDQLEQLHVVRSELRAGAVWNELSHDQFVEAVEAAIESADRSAGAEAVRAQRWQDRAVHWAERGRTRDDLLSPSEATEAAAWIRTPAAQAIGVTPVLSEFVNAGLQEQRQRERDQRNLRRTRVAAVLLLLIAFATVATTRWAFLERSRATSALSRSSTSRASAWAQAGRSPQALAYIAHALHSDPDSLSARSWLSDLLLRNSWWIPRLQIKHQDAVNAAVFSPDGHRFATAASGQARIFDADTGKPIGLPLAHQAEVYSVSFSPDGSRVVTAAEDQTARVWDALTGKPVGPVLPQKRGRVTAALSPDGRRVVTISEADSAQIWDADTGKSVGPPLMHLDVVHSAAFSRDGRLVVTASADNTAKIWDAATGQLAASLSHEGGFRSATFCPDGGRVVSTSPDHLAQIWDTRTGKSVGLPMRHGGGVDTPAFSPDGRRVVTAAEENTAQIWDAETGDPLGSPMRHQGRIHAVAFSPDGRLVVTASDDNTAHLWDGNTGNPVGFPIVHQAATTAAAFSPDGHHLLTASADKTARIWDADDGKPGPTILPDRHVRSAVFSPDGLRVLTTSSDRPDDAGTANLWDCHTGKSIGSSAQPSPVYTAGFSLDGRRVLIVSAQTLAQLDAHTGRLIGSPVQHPSPIASAYLSPDRQSVVVTSGDKSHPEIRRTDSGKAIGPPLRHLTGLGGGLDFAGFSLDGRRVLATYSWTDSHERAGEHTFWAFVRDTGTGKDVDLPIYDIPVDAASISPDGRRVAISQSDHARIFETDTGKPVGLPMEHRNRINSMVFNRDGSRILTASADWTARVWDAETGRPVSSSLQHQDSIVSAAFSPDGRRVVTASTDHTARIWAADSGEPVGLPLRHQDAVASAAFSPDGRRVLTVSGQTATIWTVILDTGSSSKEVSMLADFAEALGGYRVNEFESTVPIDDQFERMDRLRGALVHDPKPADDLPVFLRRFLSIR